MQVSAVTPYYHLGAYGKKFEYWVARSTLNGNDRYEVVIVQKKTGLIRAVLPGAWNDPADAKIAGLDMLAKDRQTVGL